MDTKNLSNKILKDPSLLLNNLVLFTNKKELPVIEVTPVDQMNKFNIFSIRLNLNKKEFKDYKKHIYNISSKSEIIHELNNEIVNILKQNATYKTCWSKTTPPNIKDKDWNTSILKYIQLLDDDIYRETMRCMASYYITYPDCIQILAHLPGWEFNEDCKILVGPYLAGYLNNKPVYVSSTFKNEFIAVVKNSDNLLTSAAVSYKGQLVKTSKNKKHLESELAIDIVNSKTIVGFKIVGE